MALLNNKGQYIKMMPHGEFSMYPNEETRLRQKIAPTTYEILQRYSAEIGKMKGELDLLHEEGREEEFKELEERLLTVQHEFTDYCNDVDAAKGATHEYPYIGQFYDNAADSIPNIIEGGILPFDSEDVTVIYGIVKEEMTFGYTEDV